MAARPCRDSRCHSAILVSVLISPGVNGTSRVRCAADAVDGPTSAETISDPRGGVGRCSSASRSSRSRTSPLYCSRTMLATRSAAARSDRSGAASSASSRVSLVRCISLAAAFPVAPRSDSDSTDSSHFRSGAKWCSATLAMEVL